MEVMMVMDGINNQQETEPRAHDTAPYHMMSHILSPVIRIFSIVQIPARVVGDRDFGFLG